MSKYCFLHTGEELLKLVKSNKNYYWSVRGEILQEARSESPDFSRALAENESERTLDVLLRPHLCALSSQHQLQKREKRVEIERDHEQKFSRVKIPDVPNYQCLARPPR